MLDALMPARGILRVYQIAALAGKVDHLLLVDSLPRPPRLARREETRQDSTRNETLVTAQYRQEMAETH